MLSRLIVIASLLSASVSAGLLKRQDASTAPPTAKALNGTYVGYRSSYYGTENFLGIPYAQPPVDQLRFRVPQSLNTTWSGSRNATRYGPECIGYGLDTESQGNYVSEDCLTLNVIRSTGAGSNLPVVVWIHGGGLVMGGSADRRYNQTFIVQQAAEAGTPIVAVSINYRLSAWGFLYGAEIQNSGNAMLGFRDQRLALHWIRENIAAFGGDPSRVTIQGESSGGTSVGAQLLAYNGRDDGIFAHAIAESGAPIGLSPYPTVQSQQPVYDNITRAAGCSNSSDTLACLRTLSTSQLNAIINSTATAGARYGPVIDNDFIVTSAAEQLSNGNFVHVPYIIGCNADEGTSFGPRQINTTAEYLAYIRSQGLDNATAQDMAILYPDIPAIGVPSTLQGRPNSTIGLQYKRSSAAAGDISMHAPRRLTAQMWAAHGAPMYTYVFDVLVNGQPYTAGAAHFQEVGFVFYNTEGLGYAQNLNPNPLGGIERPKYLDLAQLMVRMWISFVNTGNPNTHLGVAANTWPVYTPDDAQVFLFSANESSYAEPDLYRAEGIQYVSELMLARHGTNCTGLLACGVSDTN